MRGLKIHSFNGGLWVAGGKEQTPEGALRRNRGANAIKTGSLRSRLGSTLLYSLTAHSLFRYNDVRFAGVSTSLYRDGSSIYALLDGSRLAFVTMPPQTDVFDYLFIAGGGDLIKVDSSGNVSQWGIAAPNNDPSAAIGAAGVLNAVYKYKVVFKNRTSGSRSNPNSGEVSITATNDQVDLTNIPVSSDPQVDGREIYRTVGGGERYFLLTELTDNTTTSYTDNAADSALDTFELQQDNIPPEDTYDDCWGPYAGLMWWCRNSTSTERGRTYYSALSRPEAVRSSIEVSNNDDPTQKGLVWDGSNYVFTEKGLYQILGDAEPFVPVKREGIPGTINPFSVKGTPYGIIYKALDGIRLFDGNTSRLIGFDAIGPLLRGESAENLTAFDPVIAEFAKDEVFFSDTAQTLALNLKDGTWRDLGLGCTAFYQEKDTRHLQASFSGKIVSLEDFATVSDDGTAIPIAWEVGGALSDIGQTGLCQRLYIDINSGGQNITVAVIADGTTYSLAPLQTSSRQVVEYSVGINARVLSVRLTGNVSMPVELFGVEADVYLAPTERMG